MSHILNYTKLAHHPLCVVHCKRHPGVWHLDTSSPSRFARLERGDLPDVAICETSGVLFSIQHTATGFEATPVAAKNMTVKLAHDWLAEVGKPETEAAARAALDAAFEGISETVRNDAAREFALGNDLTLMDIPLPSKNDAALPTGGET